MDYAVKTERLDERWEGDLKRAAELLRCGGTVAFPTETVYGLGANALDPGAVARIFEAKQRPGWDPLIVHVCDREMLGRVALMETEFAGRADRLMEAFWPGALTLLLPRTAEVPDAVTAGRALVGVRMPAHATARKLIALAGMPVAAPSANRFGHTSPTTVEHVLADLEGRIDAVLAGPASRIGVESTVLDPTQWPMVVYRAGAVTVAMIEALCGSGAVEVFRAPEGLGTPESLPSPGVGIRHYAPKARVVLVNAESPDPRGSLVTAIEACSEACVGVLLPDGWDAGNAKHRVFWGSWDQQEVLARRLFAGLRELDYLGCEAIVCPVPGGEGIGAAIRDRLEKAARTS